MGLLDLQAAFLKECRMRLFAPLEFMFPEAVLHVNDAHLPLLLLPLLLMPPPLTCHYQPPSCH